jgi:microcystin-dependent protein
MSYQVTFTEINNPLKPPVTVEDQTINTQTSMTFIGKNYAGYGPLIAKNFLHLLENSASPTKPATQVQGQLWFDNNPDISQLKVNIDGTPNGWVSAGGIKKSPSVPLVTSSIQGDLWVDTVNQQLSLFTGSGWLLVGPTFSAGSQTGPKLEQIVDTLNVSHTVQSIYVENQRVMIISTSTFTPKATQAGYEIINKGVNLYTPPEGTSIGELFKYHGIVTESNSLTDPANAKIPLTANSFLRTDDSKGSTTNYPINVRNAGGITIGTDTGSVTIFTEANSNTATFYAKSGNAIGFKVNTNGTPVTVLHLDPSSFVGIRKNNPTVALDVNGDIAASGALTISSTAVGSITTAGGLQVDGVANLTTLKVTGQQTVAGNILPVLSNTYDIGSDPNNDGAAFGNIYATNFWGNFNGTFSGGFTGSVSGSATKLASPTKFTIVGDVVNDSADSTNFDGQNQTVTFNTLLTSAAISARDPLDATLADDELLIYRSTETGLKKVTVGTLTAGLPTVPVGAIFPFAGKTDRIPFGYLLCDGAEVYQGQYSQLFDVLGFTYKEEADLVGQGTFCLPDLRGRMALGRDNMDNRIQVLVGDTNPIDEFTVTTPAGRVDSDFAKTLGSGGGTSTTTLAIKNLPEHTHDMRGTDRQDRPGQSYFAVRNVAGTPDDKDAIPGVGGQAAGQAQYLGTAGRVLTTEGIGVPVDLMNPYLSINYIIFTGVTA